MAAFVFVKGKVMGIDDVPARVVDGQTREGYKLVSILQTAGKAFDVAEVQYYGKNGVKVGDDVTVAVAYREGKGGKRYMKALDA